MILKKKQKWKILFSVCMMSLMVLLAGVVVLADEGDGKWPRLVEDLPNEYGLIISKNVDVDLLGGDSELEEKLDNMTYGFDVGGLKVNVNNEMCWQLPSGEHAWSSSPPDGCGEGDIIVPAWTRYLKYSDDQDSLKGSLLIKEDFDQELLDLGLGSAVTMEVKGTVPVDYDNGIRVEKDIVATVNWEEASDQLSEVTVEIVHLDGSTDTWIIDGNWTAEIDGEISSKTWGGLTRYEEYKLKTTGTYNLDENNTVTVEKNGQVSGATTITFNGTADNLYIKYELYDKEQTDNLINGKTTWIDSRSKEVFLYRGNEQLFSLSEIAGLDVSARFSVDASEWNRNVNSSNVEASKIKEIEFLIGIDNNNDKFLNEEGDDVIVVGPITLSQEDGWKGTFDEIDAFKSDEFAGIKYTVVYSYEVERSELELDLQSGALIFINATNKIIPPGALTVKKEWENDSESNRPEAIEVQLEAYKWNEANQAYEWGSYKPNEDFPNPVTLKQEDGWTYTWEDLPAYDTATQSYYKYRVRELSVPDGYTPVYSDGIELKGSDPAVFTITNTCEEEEEGPGEGSLKVEKVWKDDLDQHQAIEVQLYRNDTQYRSPVTLDSDNGWSYTWNDLPIKDENDNRYTYKVEETTKLSGYETTYTNNGIKLSEEQKPAARTSVSRSSGSSVSVASPSNASRREENDEFLSMGRADNRGLYTAFMLKTADQEVSTASSSNASSSNVSSGVGEDSGESGISLLNLDDEESEVPTITITNTSKPEDPKDPEDPEEPEDPKDPKTGKLLIQKIVTGSRGSKTKEFTFTVTLTDEEGEELSESYQYSGSKQGTITSGGSVTLKHGESVTISGLPENTRYQVVEQEANTDGYSTSSTGASGTIAADDTKEAVFTNYKPGGGSSSNRDPDPDPDPTPTTPAETTPAEETTTVESMDPEHPTTLPDPNDPDAPDRFTIWDGDTPTTYVRVWNPELEEFVWLPEGEVPLWGLPKTGDTGRDVIWVLISLLSLFGIGGLLMIEIGKKNETESK